LDLIFDLSCVDHVDAFGASALVGSVRRVRAMGGTCRILQVNAQVRWILNIVGMNRFLADSPTPDQADAA
jgi:anti-anti-sigma factor